MKKKFLTLASALTFVSLYSFNAYADMDLETSNAVSGIAVALNNYKASSISPQTALGESLKTATTNTIEITGVDDARNKLVKDVVKYEGPSIQDRLKEEVMKDDLAVAKNKKDTVVHADPKETGEEVGSISYSSVATVVGSEINETGEWVKINSGNVEGYVKASDLATGNKAKKMAKDSVVTYGTVVDIDNVRLRKTPDITSNTLTMLEGGEKYVVVGQDKNFLKVQVDDDLTGYVYKDFIKTDVSYKTAKTKEESTIEALNKAKLETEAKEAMAIYENMVVADDQTTAKSKETTAKAETTTAAKKNSDKAPTPKASEEAKTIKSPAAEKRETPAGKEVEIKVPDTTKGSTKPAETTTKDNGQTETTKQKIETVPETKTEAETIKAIEDTKPTETNPKAETVKEPSKSEEISSSSSKVNIETVNGPESSETAKETTKASVEQETSKAVETVKETPTATTQAETISAVEDTTKQTESTTQAPKQTEATTEATKPVETTKPAETTAPYGPGGSTEKPKETQKAKPQKETTVVTGENGGPGVSKKKETTKAETEATRAAKEKISRDAVVAYAKQFVGNPYVYGGTSLTKGADCSGFVMRVYEKFGISTSRVSKDQANNGTEIPVSQIKPGDLVFYSSGGEINHVAIYIGDGQIVHAANKQLGIRVGSLNHRTPVKAVRLIK